MKISKFGTMTAALLTVSAGSVYADLTLNYGPLDGSVIIFGGAADTFNFTQGTVSLMNPQGNQFSITGESGSADTGSAMGLQGNILNGPFNYGTIVTAGASQTATVTGPLGQLSISDGTGFLTGTVNFVTISTLGSVGGQLNGLLDVNLTGVSYSGLNADLAYLNANQPGTLNASFQFSPGETLTQLSTGAGGLSTSYNGSISVVPEPTSLAMSGLGALAALALSFRSRKNS